MALQDYLIDTSGQATPDQVKRRQAYADALTKGGQDYSPVQSPWQGAARLAQGLLGGYERGQANADEQAGRAGYQQRLAAALQGKDVSPQAVITAAGDPWANPAQINALSHTVDMQAQKARQAVEDQHWAANYAITKHNSERADDKTPADFETNPDFGKTPDAPQYRPVSGGPRDPAYIAQAAKAKSVNGEATLDDATTKAMADQYLAGDRTVLQNLGRGAQGAANVVKLRQAIHAQAEAAGVDPKGIVDNFNEQAGKLAGERAVGTRAANISLAANEANNMIGIAVKASEAVPRTQYMPVNQAIQMVQKGSSSPELARFVAATNSLVNAYVRAVSPSGVPTDSMRQHAYDMLNAAQSHDAYIAVTKIMQDEMKAALSAPGQVRKELRGPNDTAAAPGAPAGGSGAAPDPLGIR